MLQLAEWTGFDRATVKRRLDAAGLEGEKGRGRAIAYETRDALPILYGYRSTGDDGDGVSLEEARKRESLKRVEKMDLEMESLRRERIPLETVTETLSDCFASIRAIIKRSDLTKKAKEETFRDMREVPRKLKW